MAVTSVSVMKRHSRQRVARIVTYLLLMGTGMILTFQPSELVTDHVPAYLSYTWSVGLVVTALGCLAGSVFDRWIGEYGFLPFLFTILLFYGIVCVKWWNHNWPLLAFGFLILGFACSKIARWQDIRDIQQSSKDYHRDRG